MRARLFVAVLALMSFAACGDDSEPTDYITVSAQSLQQLGGEVSVRVQQPKRVRNITYAELMDAAKAPTYGIQLQTEKSGNIRVQFALTNTTKDTIGAAEVEMTLREGFLYSATLFRYPANYQNYCFGCTGVLKFPIRDPQKPTTDSLWIFYSANLPLCKGCVI